MSNNQDNSNSHNDELKVPLIDCKEKDIKIETQIEKKKNEENLIAKSLHSDIFDDKNNFNSNYYSNSGAIYNQSNHPNNNKNDDLCQDNHYVIDNENNDKLNNIDINKNNDSNNVKEIIANNLTREEFEQKLNDLLSDLNMLRNNNDDAIYNLKYIQECYQSLMNLGNNTLDESMKEVEKILNDNENYFNSVNKLLFEGFDDELNNSYESLMKYSKDINESYSKLSELNNELLRIQNDPILICQFHKEKNKILISTETLIIQCEKFIEEKLLPLNTKAEKLFPLISKKHENFIEKINKYKNEFQTALESNISNTSYRIRRFRHYFSFNNERTLENSALCFMVSNTICLNGLGICGLFIDNIFQSVPDLPMQLEIIETIDESQIADFVSKDTAKEETVKRVIYSKLINICSVKNIIDPVIPINFDKGVIVYTDRIYYITLKSLSSSKFIKFWSGSIENYDENEDNNDKRINNKYTEMEETMNQIVVCNDTLVKFVFVTPFGFETDYNESSTGIISDFYFCYID